MGNSPRNEAVPVMTRLLKAMDPKIFPKAILLISFLAATRVVIISGIEVPIDQAGKKMRISVLLSTLRSSISSE